MKIMLAVAIFLLGNGMVYGMDDNKSDTSVACNKKAEGTSGNERNRIISACVRRNAVTGVMPSMLGKITGCNQKAGDMTGIPRQVFMEKCMRG